MQQSSSLWILGGPTMTCPHSLACFKVPCISDPCSRGTRAELQPPPPSTPQISWTRISGSTPPEHTHRRPGTLQDEDLWGGTLSNQSSMEPRSPISASGCQHCPFTIEPEMEPKASEWGGVCRSPVGRSTPTPALG